MAKPDGSDLRGHNPLVLLIAENPIRFFNAEQERFPHPRRAGTGLSAVCPRLHSLTGGGGADPYVCASNEDLLLP